MEQTIVTAKHLQDQLWEQAVLVAKTVPTAITSLFFILSLNETIDLSERRLATLEDRVPLPIWVMLTLVSLLACLTVGMSVQRRVLYVMLVTPLTIAIVMALIADLNNPRAGLLPNRR